MTAPVVKLNIGDLVKACTAGRRLGLRRGPIRVPDWVDASPTLLMAFTEGYELARRSRKGATDGPAR